MKCFAGCDSRDVLDELRRQALAEGAPEHQAKTRRRGHFPSPPPSHEPEPDPKALRLWMASVAITGTLGETYLRKHRGLAGPFPPSIRFTRIWCERTGTEFPAIVVAISRPDRKIVAAQVTYLTNDGEKAPLAVPRLTVGRLGTGAARLAAAGDILGLAEGVETALAAMEMSGVPCWATLGAARLAGVTVADAVKTIHIFGDNDDPGREAADRAAERYTREGRRVILRFPPEGDGDFNDTLVRVAGAVAA